MLKNLKQLSDLLHDCRKKAGLSLDKAAKEAGLSKNTILRMENKCEFKTMTSLIALARIYDYHILVNLEKQRV